MLSACQSYRDGGQRTVGAFTDDVAINTAVKTALLRDPDVKGWRIDVDVHRGVVSLYGRVPSTFIRDKAVSIARTKRGVQKVLDKLTLVELD